MPAKKPTTVIELDKRVSTHEAICAERYHDIIKRLARVEQFLLGAMVLLIVSMASVIYVSLAK